MRNVGGMAYRVLRRVPLRRVPVPLLTVSHVEAETHATGLVSLKRILYATDLCESSSIGLKYAIELACRTGAQLTPSPLRLDLNDIKARAAQEAMKLQRWLQRERATVVAASAQGRSNVSLR